MRKLKLLILLMVPLLAQARDPAQVRAFRADHPCPSTGHTAGPCKGWVVDHGIPLCVGGADRPYNMHWQKQAESYLKDADERRICRQCGAKP